MNKNLLEIINEYGVLSQLKYFQSEVFELNEAIIEYENTKRLISNVIDIRLTKNHIAEEIADNLVMLKQFQYYYGIKDEDIEEIMKYKINRQLDRIKTSKN